MKYTVLFSSFLCLSLLSACQNKNPEIEKIEKLCLIESEKIAGKSAGIVKYCACAAPKIFSHVKNDKHIMAKLAEGEFNHINELKDSTFKAALNNCVDGDILIYNPPSMELLLPKRAENSIRVTIMDEMDAEFHATHNMEQYCDCYIKSIKTKLTFEEFHDNNLENLPKYKAILKDCETISKE